MLNFLESTSSVGVFIKKFLKFNLHLFEKQKNIQTLFAQKVFLSNLFFKQIFSSKLNIWRTQILMVAQTTKTTKSKTRQGTKNVIVLSAFLIDFRVCGVSEQQRSACRWHCWHCDHSSIGKHALHNYALITGPLTAGPSPLGPSTPGPSPLGP